MSFVFKQNSNDCAIYSIPICVEDTNYDVTLTITSDENVENAFLFTSEEFEDIISVKLSSNENYREISAYSSTPTAFLGSMTADVAVSVDFRINFPSADSYSGEYIIPIGITDGESFSPFYFLGDNPFLIENTTEDPTFYLESTDECDNYWTVSEY